MIQGHGPSEPLAIILGDGGTPEEEQLNYALVGNTERTFRAMMKEAGLRWEMFYKTLLIKEPINFSSEKSKGKKGMPYFMRKDNLDKLTKYQEIVQNEINSLNPNLIIPTGEMSFRFLTGLHGIRKFRGSVLLAREGFGQGKFVKVLPILGPVPYLNQEYELRWPTKIDIHKIPRYCNDSLPPENRHNIWIAQSSSALRAFLERSYRKDGLLVFDIETFMGLPTCISFCFDGNESVCIPFTDKSIDPDNRILMIQLVGQILASPIAKVNQNIKYDWKVLERFGFEVKNVIGDTLLAANCIYPELPKNLGFLTSIYTDLPYFKDEGKIANDDEGKSVYDPTRKHKKQFYLYNAKDSLATYQIYEKQMGEIKELGTDFVYEQTMKLLPIYKRMETRGFLIDEEARLSLLGKYTSLFNIHTLKLRRWLNNSHFNPLSSAQCDTVVYDVLGYKKDRRTKGTGEKILEYLLVFSEPTKSPVFGEEILRGILAVRKFKKVIELLELYRYPDNRLRCEYKLAGTTTGRTSASVTTDEMIIRSGDAKKPFSIVDLGHSFQTFGKHGFIVDGEHYGKDVRKIFVPTPGYSFVEVDLSQAEARVDTVLAGNYDLLQVFDSPTGIHRLTGSWVFGCKPEDIKKNTLEYHLSKIVRHAGERNLKEDTLVMLTQQTRKECQRILKVFHDYQPEIQNTFHREVRDAIDRDRVLRSPNGRLRTFLGRIDQHLYNEAISQLPQSIVSDQTKFSFIPTLESCPYAFLVNEAHDGSLAEIPIGREMEYIEEYVRNVTQPIDFRTCTLARDFELIIPAEASMTQGSWYDLKDVELPKKERV